MFYIYYSQMIVLLKVRCVIKTPVLPSDPAPLPLQVDSHLTFGASYQHDLTSESINLNDL